MKTLLTLVLSMLSLATHASINRCEIHNKLICQNLKAEMGSTPTKEMFFFIKAIVEKESGWDEMSSRQEPDGRVSYGLMHVLDETAAEMGLSNPKAMYKADIALRYGIRYALKKIKEAQNKPRGEYSVWRKAAAGYNAGSIRYRANGTLICHSENIGNGKRLGYDEAIENLQQHFLQECRHWSIQMLCK
ncbi:MAG: lytic transglycosylase domain-containing protein [Bacteriovoracia bacterium]